MDPNKKISPEELKKILREANRDLDRVDELTEMILEQRKLSDMEKSISEI